MTIRESIAPSVAAADTVPSVVTGMKSAVRKLLIPLLVSVYMYCKTYPPASNGAVDVLVGSLPL